MFSVILSFLIALTPLARQQASPLAFEVRAAENSCSEKVRQRGPDTTTWLLRGNRLPAS